MWAGGHYSDFKPVKRTRKAILELKIAEAPPSNWSTQGGGATVPYVVSTI